MPAKYLATDVIEFGKPSQTKSINLINSTGN